jgi:predicted TIM-barrel fold metal-dependent hydrolase
MTATADRTRPEHGYRLISADAHVNEPPGLWTERVPRALRDRAPRIERFEQGDAWVIEGVDDPISFGMNACAGLPPDEMRAWVRFEELRRGGHDPAARIDEMLRDGVDAEVLYPTPRLFQGIVANPDPDYHLAMVRAYNDWLSEYVEYAPDRFAGLAAIPNRGAKLALEEMNRVQGRPGIRGFLLGCYPNGTLEPMPEDDAVWGLLEELGLPVNIHVALTQAMPRAHKAKLPGWGRIFDVGDRMVQMIFDGIFDRFPRLEVAIAEVDCGWVPYVKEQIDNNYRRLDPNAGFGLAVLPSSYIERHFHFGFITDTFGIDQRHRIGVERMLWSSDYPHISADWPHSQRAIETAFRDVPSDEKERILCGNAQRLYGFGSAASG